MKLKWCALFVLVVLGSLTGCAQTQYQWYQQSWAKTNFQEAHTDCMVKARAVYGYQANVVDWNNYMSECMNGQGYFLKDVGPRR